MDLDTFFTTLYVIIDDWYKAKIIGMKPKRGRPPQLTDSEVLTLAIAAQWRSGVPWQSERGFVRYMLAHGRGWFPHMVSRNTFNYRVRYLFGVIVALQHALTDLLTTTSDLFEAVDTLELPAYSSGQANRQRHHWLNTAGLGWGAYGRWYWGHTLLASISQSGVVTGWLIGSATFDDRWLLEGFLSSRSGSPQLREPERRRKAGWSNATPPPVGYLGGFSAVGRIRQNFYLADKGFDGERWATHWRTYYNAQVITIPQGKSVRLWSVQEKKWLSHYRQIVETVFSVLDATFNIKQLQAHSLWGQLTRVACKIAGFNLGVFLNLCLGRNRLSHQTLLC